MKYRIIANPGSAGGKTAGKKQLISYSAKKYLQDFDIAITTHAGHATELAAEAVNQGVEAVLVVGGDGTINEVVNGLASSDSPAIERPILGVIPSGSGSDFSRTFNLSNSVEESIQRVANNNPVTIDVGRLTPVDGESRLFANISSAGLSAEIGLNTNKIKWLKKINGPLAYNWTILTTTLKHQRFPVLIKTSEDPDGKVWDANCVAICNGQYFGGGVRIAREANPSDGLLNVVIVHDLPPMGFLKGVTQIKKDDSVMPEGITKTTAKWIEISSEETDRDVFIETDGEFAGTLPARFEVVPSAIRLF